ncbi:MAG: T9SS type A sorting domain-containing protein [Parafilimonas sp.]
MKKIYSIFLLISIISITQPNLVSAQVNVQDSIALVAIYNSMGGAHWRSSINWLTTAPVQQWEGITVQNNRVVTVQLGSYNLNGILPAEIGYLTHVEKFDLRENHNISGTIPPEIGNMKNLKELFIYNSKLTGSIPHEIGKLKMLEALYFNGDLLTGSLPAEIGYLTNLETIDVHYNRLSDTLPRQLGNLKNISTLSLSSNNFTGSIPVQLKNLTNLVWLDLSRNQLTGKIPSGLGDLSILNYLDLSFNKLEGFIPTHIADLPSNLRIYLNNNNFTFAGMVRIDKRFYKPAYSPQATIPMHYNNNILSVSVGGILAFNTYNWYKNGTLYQTITGDSTLPVNESGSYYVVATSHQAPKLTLYSDTINYTMGNNLIATNLSNKNLSASLYPNPVKENATLTFYAQGKYTIKVVDFSGKLMQIRTGIAVNGEKNMLQLDASKFANGLYMVTISDEKNNNQILKINKSN